MAQTAIACINGSLSGFDELVGPQVAATTIATRHAQIDGSVALEGAMLPMTEYPVHLAITGGDSVVRTAKRRILAYPEVHPAHPDLRFTVQGLKCKGYHSAMASA